ncbi:MAG: T9SS type A sorting domain-containing protein [Bacteroidales bacterium]|nr:T9SS type A sorting domain-containing protein [Bacteroidales bacterium]
MKYIAFLGALLISTLIFAQPDIEKTKEIASFDAFNASRHFDVPEKFVGQKYDLKYHRFYWILDPAEDSIRGYVCSYFTAVQANLSQIDFSLENSLLVDSVMYHGAAISYTHSSDIVSATLPVPLALGTLDSIEVHYHGEPAGMSGFGSFIVSTHDVNTPVLWTLSEPYGAYEWWPCKNALSDKIDSIDVYVQHPSAYKAASNGLLQSETPFGGDIISHWKHRYPIATYLIAVAVTDYAVYNESFALSQGPLLMQNYIFPEDSATSAAASPTLEDVMQFYDSLIAPYPYMNEKYGHAQFGWGGGMEHQTMSFMGGFGYELMAHELLHQWFGDAVTCGTWQDIWLNEGFAVYYTALNYEHTSPNYYWKIWKRQAVDYICSEPNGSVFVYDTSDVSRVFSSRLTYYKGSYILHMLRWVMGDSAFFQGNRNYFNDNYFDYAYTDDLISHLETSSGMQLDEFFDDWFYGEGYPIYSINVSWNGIDTVGVNIQQAQTDPSVSFFEMPVPLQFWHNGQDTTIVFDHTFSGEDFYVNLGYFPDSVIFDPELWILSKYSTVFVGMEEESPVQLASYPNPVSGFLMIDLPENTAATVQVFTATGELVKKENISNVQKYRMETSDFAQGAYLIRIDQGQAHYVSSFVKL